MANPPDTQNVSPFDRIGGLVVLRRISDRFYDLMETETEFAALRAMHAPDLAPMRESLPLFLAGWSGGPRTWWEANPGKCMVSMHAPLGIDRVTAGQWANAMRRAITDIAPGDTVISEALADILERMAMGMAKA
ncbi:globin [Novosphingobium sp.]|uniref:globin domain-containing protein n=1 Tax=Novosphingobium sp. TaxID=1874826 RepID=UPI0026197B17|nr:globin [Novosphingobium sp.]